MFQRIQSAGLKLSMNKRTFGQNKNEVSEKRINRQGIATIPDNIAEVLGNLKFSMSVNLLQRYKGTVKFYRQYSHRLAKKLIPLYQILTKGHQNSAHASAQRRYFRHQREPSQSCQAVLRTTSG